MQCTFEETVDLPGGGFQHTKCVEDAKIFIGGSCYGLCYFCAYKKLEVENKELRDYVYYVNGKLACGRAIMEYLVWREMVNQPIIDIELF